MPDARSGHVELTVHEARLGEPHTPAHPSVCPRALLIVLANAGRTENWRRIHANANVPSSGEWWSTRAMSTVLSRPAAAPGRAHSSSRPPACTPRTTSRVPLHSPSQGERLRSSITTIPGYRSRT